MSLYYVVVHADGTVRLNLYNTKGKAQNKARRDGDAVVEVHVDLEKAPLFIRKQADDEAREGQGQPLNHWPPLP